MEINQEAPAIASGAIEIAAPPEVVWDVLTAFERWPSWNPDVKSVAVSGPLAEGTEFKWQAGPSTITSTLRRVDSPALVGWTGKTLGINAIHGMATRRARWGHAGRDRGVMAGMPASTPRRASTEDAAAEPRRRAPTA